jgi:hypothetical protein
MKTFEIEIKEILSRTIEVKTNTEDEALEIVRQQYNNEEIVLDSSDFVDIYFNNIENS